MNYSLRLKPTPRQLDLSVFCALGEMAEENRLEACARLIRTIESSLFKTDSESAIKLNEVARCLNEKLKRTSKTVQTN